MKRSKPPENPKLTEEGSSSGRANEGCQIVVLKPTWEQFKNFRKYCFEFIVPAFSGGLVKVIPPEEWHLNGCKPTFSEDFQYIDALVIENPVEQHTTPHATQGIFIRNNKKLKQMTAKDLRIRNGGEKLAGKSYQQQEHDFWLHLDTKSEEENATTAKKKSAVKPREIPVYGVDIQNTRFPKTSEIW